MKRFLVIGLGVALAAAMAVPSRAAEKCKAKINSKDGTILVSARKVTGTLLWGYTAGTATTSFADPTCVDSTSGTAKNCTLGAVGTPERITPPDLCRLSLADGSGTCEAFIKKCTPGRRTVCPSDMARVGNTCVDKYEASVWSSPTGGTQFGVSPSTDDYPCSDPAQNCTGGNAIYARSVAGVTPSSRATWFQAQQACASVGKRLLTNAEWQMAVAGTPDTDAADDGVTTCNTAVAQAVVATGSRSGCVSNWGVLDMVGNLREWVADWIPVSGGAPCPGWGFTSDMMCLFGAVTNRPAGENPGVLLRGGAFSDTVGLSGPFAVDGTPFPLFESSLNGFRCAR